MEIISASVWGREITGRPSAAKPRQIKELTIHYTGAPSISAKAGMIDEHIKRTEQNHKARPNENMSTIGYNFLIDEYGRVWEGRGFNIRNGANGSSSNDTSYSVCVLVGVEDNKVSPIVVNAIRWLREQVERHTKNKIQVRGHKDHIPTSCPGPALYRQVRNGTFLKPSEPMAPTAPIPAAPATVAPATPAKPGAPEKPATCAQQRVKRGDSGRCVRLVQERLVAHGHKPGPVDGDFGDRTRRAVIAFQKKNGLSADGIVGPKETWPALIKEPS